MSQSEGEARRGGGARCMREKGEAASGGRKGSYGADKGGYAVSGTGR